MKLRPTYTGIDSNTDISKLPKDCEIGILYTTAPEGRNRYPEKNEILSIIQQLKSDSIALHICGSNAKIELMDGIIDNIVKLVNRVQINGVVDYDYLKEICTKYPDKIFITQHNRHSNNDLLKSELSNHAILVDNSGGNGISPNEWERPLTTRPVGFAGGLRESNILDETDKITLIATSDSWIDMEGKIRNENDWFDEERVSVIHGLLSMQL